MAEIVRLVCGSEFSHTVFQKLRNVNNKTCKTAFEMMQKRGFEYEDATQNTGSTCACVHVSTFAVSI